MDQNAIVFEICKTLWTHKGWDIVPLDVRHMTVVCESMVIVTGRSTTQVRALSDYVGKRMEELGVELRRIEGRDECRWIIMDYGSVLVEIFHPEEREYYNIERLWEDGTNRMDLPYDQDE